MRSSSIIATTFALIQTGLAAAPSNYPGYANIKYLFIFGASLDSTQRPSNDFTTSGGLMWPDYLTTTYNKGIAKVLTDRAFPGATTSASIVKTYTGFIPISGAIPTLEDQLEEFWVKHPIGGDIPWTANNSLFIFGSSTGNDLLSSSANQSVVQPLVAKWQSLMDTAYQQGARNFVFLPVPPIDATPKGVSKFGPVSSTPGSTWQGMLNWMKSYNAGLQGVANTINTYGGTTSLWYPQFRDIFDKVIASPAAYGFLDVTTACTGNYIGYGWTKSKSDPDHKSAGCTYLFRQYLFHDDLHPTFPMHDLLAKEISAYLP